MLFCKRVFFVVVVCPFVFLTVSGQDLCRGCSTDTNCHVFDPGNSKYVGCHGTFTDGPNGWDYLCSPGFRVMNLTNAFDEGFTKTMCDTAPVNEMFFLDESGDNDECNTEYATSDTDTIWGCSGSPLDLFDGNCFSSFECDVSGTPVLSFVCAGQVTNILEQTTGFFGINTADLLNAQYGGVICIRDPTMAPTFMPTLEPTAPTLNPSDVPSTEPSDFPSTDPTAAPTRMPTLTMYPTDIPSTEPSGMPSGMPSTEPTHVPSGQPSGSPSEAPTKAPNVPKEKEIEESPIKGVDMTTFLIGSSALGGFILCCSICIIVLARRNRQNKKQTERANSSNMQMNQPMRPPTQQQFAPQTTQQYAPNRPQQQTYNTNNEMAQFSIQNVAKTRQ